MHRIPLKRRWQNRLWLPSVPAAIAAAVCGFLCMLAPAANAGSDPNPVTRQLEERQLGKGLRKAPPLQRPASVDHGGSGQGASFALRSVSIAGATVIGEAELKGHLTAYLGRVVGPADLAAMTKLLTYAYGKRGYFLSRATIEPQDVARGHLRIRVIEGYVKEVRVAGANLDRYRLDDALAPISQERPLRFAHFERTLLLAGDTAGVQILDTSLEVITAEPGAYRFTVSVAAKPVSAAVTVDNRTAEGLADVQIISSGALASVLLARDEVSVATATTARGLGELAFVGGAYEAVLGVSGLSFGVFASRSVLAPGDERRLVETETRSDVAGVKVGYKALRSLDQTLKLTAAFTAMRAEESTTAGRTYEDVVHALTLGANYQVRDPLGGINFLQVTARQGLGFGSANGRWDDESSRYDASGVFTKATMFASRYQPIDDRWFTRVSALAQISADPLLNSEQLYLGGGQFGRAYHSGEFGGDHGVALALEAGMILPWRNDLMRRAEVFGFVDGGYLGFRGGELDGNTSLLSVGAGVRASVGEHHQLQLEFALPIDVGPADDQGGRIFFSLTSAIHGCGLDLGC